MYYILQIITTNCLKIFLYRLYIYVIIIHFHLLLCKTKGDLCNIVEILLIWQNHQFINQPKNQILVFKHKIQRKWAQNTCFAGRNGYPKKKIQGDIATPLLIHLLFLKAVWHTVVCFKYMVEILVKNITWLYVLLLKN